MGAEAPDRDPRGHGRHPGADPRCSTWSCPRASSRCRTPASSSASRRRPSPSPSPPWPSASRRSAASILKDPDVAGLSSFIGIDGINTTPNSGRIQITLKPREERSSNASEIIRRLQPELAKVDGHHPLHAAGAGPARWRAGSAAPSSSTRSRTRTPPSSPTGRRASLEKLRTRPELRDVASDQQSGGLEVVAGHRPRHRVPARHPAPGHRRRALRRLRPAAGLDDLHPAQPVPRGARGRPALPATRPRP